MDNASVGILSPFQIKGVSESVNAISSVLYPDSKSSLRDESG